MDDIHHIAELFQSLAKHLVSDPDSLTLSVIAAENDGYIFRIAIGKRDAGKLIGRAGRTARSMRILLGALSSQRGQRIRLDITGHADASALPH